MWNIEIVNLKTGKVMTSVPCFTEREAALLSGDLKIDDSIVYLRIVKNEVEA